MYIAQLNIAKAKAELENPLMKEFVNNLEPINQIADSSPGFIWRFEEELDESAVVQLFHDRRFIVNVSVWESIEQLKHFIFKTHHLHFLKRKAEWFEKIPEANHVLWHIPENHIPTIEEAKERLFHLRENGESPYAFSFKSKQEIDSA